MMRFGILLSRTHDLYTVSAVRSSFEILTTPQGYLPHHAACFARLFFFTPCYFHISESHKSRPVIAFITAILQFIWEEGDYELCRSSFSLGMTKKPPPEMSVWVSDTPCVSDQIVIQAYPYYSNLNNNIIQILVRTVCVINKYTPFAIHVSQSTQAINEYKREKLHIQLHLYMFKWNAEISSA